MVLLKATIGALGAGAAPPNGGVTTEERITEESETRLTENGEIRETEGIMTGGFTPTDIANCEDFIDPDTSNITFSSGNVVQQIDDESGNGRNFQQLSVPQQPILDTVTGLTALTFDGSNDSLLWTGTQFPLGAWTFFIAARHITRTSTGNTWFAATDGAGADQDVGFRGRYEGTTGNEAWALRMFFNGVLGTQVNLSATIGGTLGDAVWLIVRGDGQSPNRVVDFETNSGLTPSAVTTADPNPIAAMSLGERLSGSSQIGSFAHIGLYAFGIYSQQVTGVDLTDLRTWLNDRIVP